MLITSYKQPIKRSLWALALLLVLLLPLIGFGVRTGFAQGTPAHMVMALDRSGSMTTTRTATGNTRCEDAIIHPDYGAITRVNEFLDDYPDGKVSVRTFAGNGWTEVTNGFVGRATAIAALNGLDPNGCSDRTPLAITLCDASFDLVLSGASHKRIHLSSDGEENSSSGQCAGPPSGSSIPPYDSGSWHQKVWNLIVGFAIVDVDFWGTVQLQAVDSETGQALSANSVPITDFLQELAASTNGTYTYVDDSNPTPSNPCGISSSTDTLLACWEFNGNADDSSGNGVNGVPHQVDFSSGTYATFSGTGGSPAYDGSYIEIPADLADLLRPGTAGFDTLVVEAKVRMHDTPSVPGIGKPGYYQNFFSIPEMVFSAHGFYTANSRPTWNMPGKKTTISYPACPAQRWGCGPNLWSNPSSPDQYYYWGWNGTGQQFVTHNEWKVVRLEFDAAAGEVTHYIDGTLIETYELTDNTNIMRRDGTPGSGKFGLIGASVHGTDFTHWLYKGDIDYLAFLATSSTAPVSIPLEPGWNLISIPLQPADSDITQVLASISGDYDLVVAYHGCDAADPWKKYDPSAPPFANDLNNADETMGVWIHATAATTLEVTGAAQGTTTIPLCSGWNLTGYPSSQVLPTADAFNSIAGQHEITYTYDAADSADPWKKYDSSAPPFANDLTEMRSKLGYWTNMTQDADWLVNN